MKSKTKKTASAEVCAERGGMVEELCEEDRLAKFFEILLQIDRRQKGNGKNN